MKTLQRLTLLVVLCLTAVSAKSNNVRSSAVTSTPASSHNQRRELGVSDWWYTLLNLLHAPCPSDHDHTLTPHGHCAHHSHHPSSSHHSSGGSSHSSSSNGGSSGGGGGGGGCGGSDDCWDDDGHHDDGEWGDDGHHDDDNWGDDGHEWGDDGHVEDDKWDDDGYHDDDKYSYWAGDAHNDDGGSSSHWWSQKSYATSGYNNADDNGSSSSMKSKLLWPLTVLGALFVGLIALVVSRKRRRNQNNEVPENVYVEQTDGRTIGTHDSVEHGRGGDETDRSVKSSGSRKSLKSRVGSIAGSIKSKFSRKKSNGNNGGDLNDYDAPFDNDHEYESAGGVYM